MTRHLHRLEARPTGRRRARTHLLILGLALATAALATATPMGPFPEFTAQYLGAPVTRAGHYDLFPTALYEPDDPGREFKLYWLGSYDASEPDLPPTQHEPGDRIYLSTSSDGQTWTTPQVVLKGRGGQTGVDAADDHLVGSPSVLKIAGKYYMFYEAYSWFTTVTRFFSFDRGDTWSHHGYPEQTADWQSSYQIERYLGIAPRYPKPGTHPIYAGEVLYSFGKYNRYASCQPTVDQGGGHTWSALNEGRALLYLYDDDGPGRKPLYACFDAAFSNSFVSDDPNCEGRLADSANGCIGHLLGYSIDSVNAPDMRHANQNRVCMATSSDGVAWVRFDGAAPGRAMVAPMEPFSNEMPPHACGAQGQEPYDLHRHYGSGFPTALVRDDHLELYFSDDTADTLCQPRLFGYRLRVPLHRIEDPQAYLQAVREPLLDTQGAHVGMPDDAAWSEMWQRYLHTGFLQFSSAGFCEPGFVQSPILVWSQRNASAEPWSPMIGRSPEPLPTNGLVGASGTLLRDALGHSVDFPDAPTPYTALHLFYFAIPNCGGVFDADIHHTLAFAYGQCAFALSSSAASFTANGGSSTVALTSDLGNCAWTATTSSSWLIIRSATTGRGATTVAYDVLPNPAGSPRSASITVGGRTHTVTQAGASCSLTIDSANQGFGAAAATGQVIVTSSTSGCTWTATSNTAWIAITSGSNGSGSGAVTFAVQANGSPSPRTATLTVAGRTHTVTQSSASAGRGDFNNDGFSDLVWRHATEGANALWLMSAEGITESRYLPWVADLSWVISGAGDFDRDGHTDVVLSNRTTGHNAVWFLVDGRLVAGAYLPPIADLAWELRATGDLNGDGAQDVVWRHRTDGRNAVWFLDGSTLIGSAYLAQVNPSWSLVGAADFNADGSPDLIWRDSATGDNALWLMAGSTIATTSALPSLADQTWQIAAIGDYDRDGQPDLVWRNATSGGNGIWLLNGVQVRESMQLPTIAGPWELVGPR